MMFSQIGLFLYHYFSYVIIEGVKMMICPLCGSAGHTRSSFQISTTTKERYIQCQNLECSHTFVTHETFVRTVSNPNKVSSAPPHPDKGGQSHMNF